MRAEEFHQANPARGQPGPDPAFALIEMHTARPLLQIQRLADRGVGGGASRAGLGG
ncbi:MAG: hypothetical protein WAN22_31525 [Solirubrobacteraceae bacterium]